MYRVLRGDFLALSTVGILGQIVTIVGADCHIRRGGRGEEWSGDACVAHGGQARSGRGTGRRATQGSPPFLPATPAPTGLFVSQNSYP